MTELLGIAERFAVFAGMLGVIFGCGWVIGRLIGWLNAYRRPPVEQPPPTPAPEPTDPMERALAKAPSLFAQAREAERVKVEWQKSRCGEIHADGQEPCMLPRGHD